MKKIFTFLIFIIIASNSFSQLYTPFPAQSAQWNCEFSERWVLGWGEGAITDHMSYFTNGDTLINAITYTQLLNTRSHTEFTHNINTGHDTTVYSYWGVSYAGAYRNDSINKKVFFIPAYYYTEKTLYDFNLTPGDTIKDWTVDSVNGWWTSFGYNEAVVVDSIDSILIDNTYRIRLNVSGGMLPEALIAGIGPTSGILNPVIGTIFDVFGGHLFCFSINSQTIFPDTNSSCLTLSISENRNSPVLEIYPNPAQDYIVITSPYSETNYFIYDNLGRLVLSGKASGLVNLPSMSNGIYSVELISKSLRINRILSIQN